MLVQSMLPGKWPNQIVKNLFALINVKENGRSEGMSRSNLAELWKKHSVCLDLCRNYATRGNFTGRTG